MTSIRPAQLSDITVIHRILNDANIHWTKAMIQSCFDAQDLLWVLDNHTGVVAVLIVRALHDTWEILQLAVHKLYLRQGFAKGLLSFLMDHARANKIIKIQLEVRVSNQAAVALYRQFGFQSVGIRKRYYADGEDALLMDHLLK